VSAAGGAGDDDHGARDAYEERLEGELADLRAKYERLRDAASEVVRDMAEYDGPSACVHRWRDELSAALEPKP